MLFGGLNLARYGKRKCARRVRVEEFVVVSWLASLVVCYSSILRDIIIMIDVTRVSASKKKVIMCVSQPVSFFTLSLRVANLNLCLNALTHVRACVCFGFRCIYIEHKQNKEKKS